MQCFMLKPSPTEKPTTQTPSGEPTQSPTSAKQSPISTEPTILSSNEDIQIQQTSSQ